MAVNGCQPHHITGPAREHDPIAFEVRFEEVQSSPFGQADVD